ncbi:AsmA family protein [Flavobacterium sp. RNTU_13]|uniref:AsmA family protein n=1 Tax=Flavobacterium sp. RNTU_13 TaxID=3375145 RepID=UPI003988489C
MTETLPPSNKNRFLKLAARFIGGLVLLLVVAYAGLAFYLHTHKEEVLKTITETLNENISGQLTVSSMETTLIEDFPGISVSLKNVVLRDSLYDTHKHTFLKAGYVGVAVNILGLLRGVVQVNKVTINNAAIDLYTAQNGYSNTAVFKKSKSPDDKPSGESSFPELKYVLLKEVKFSAENKRNQKQYSFNVHRLGASLDFKGDVIKAAVQLDGFANTMAFNTGRGSFIKNKSLKGNFDITYYKNNKVLAFAKMPLAIGSDTFTIGAKLGMDAAARFSITIENNAILWKDAAALLSPNITKKLMLFAISKPIDVRCDLVGGFNEKNDPLIQVNARVANNVLTVPGGTLNNCSFFGVFTNQRQKGKGYTDANSAIKLFGFKGAYKGVPVNMKRFEIRDLDNPIAVGALTTAFNVKALNGITDASLLKLTDGTAKAQLTFRADVERFRLVKPLVQGSVSVKNAAMTYVPRGMNFKGIAVDLHFTKDNLRIDKVLLKTGKSSFVMDGSVQNFLNLYYNAPEKLVLKWNVYSPQLYLEEFMSFLKARKVAVQRKPQQKQSDNANVVNALADLFENGTIDMAVKAARVHYKKFTATNAHALISLNEDGNILLKNAGLNHAGGSLEINGMVKPGGTTKYNLAANVNNTDISQFFYAFDNFGMQTLNSKNLKGKLSAKADVTGSVNSNGVLLPRSINGSVTFTLKNGKLVNFEPLVNVGKFAFPFRDIKNIAFKDLNGKLDIMGEKVQVSPLKISSSVLNMDVEGVYSFGAGTLLYIDVPLRNPEKDKEITDAKELAKRRNRGIVIHLVAEDGDDGKVKIRLGKKR